MPKKVKWEKLKDSIELEKELTNKMLKKSKRENDFKNCIESEQSLAVLNWITEEMQRIEKT